jgi:hypothetical protein
VVLGLLGPYVIRKMTQNNDDDRDDDDHRAPVGLHVLENHVWANEIVNASVSVSVDVFLHDLLENGNEIVNDVSVSATSFDGGVCRLGLLGNGIVIANDVGVSATSSDDGVRRHGLSEIVTVNDVWASATSSDDGVRRHGLLGIVTVNDVWVSATSFDGGVCRLGLLGNGIVTVIDVWVSVTSSDNGACHRLLESGSEIANDVLVSASVHVHDSRHHAPQHHAPQVNENERERDQMGTLCALEPHVWVEQWVEYARSQVAVGATAASAVSSGSSGALETTESLNEMLTGNAVDVHRVLKCVAQLSPLVGARRSYGQDLVLRRSCSGCLDSHGAG